MQDITIKKEEYYKMLSDNIIIKDIYIKNNLKNYNLLEKIIELLAKTSKMLSAREIHKILKYYNITVSHITIIEYLDYILKSGLIKKIYRFDLKLDNISTGKAKYVFSNTNIRKCILNGKINKSILNENIVYYTLTKIGYNNIYTGKNGTFIFSFISHNNIIHVSHNIDKNEIKKEINKLKKIKGDFNKYIIINSIKEIGIRPSTYLPIKVLEIEDFIKKIK